MQRGAPREIARYGVVVVLAVLAVASLLVPFHLEGLRLAIGVAMVVILAAVLIRAPAEMRRRGEVERANQQLRDEIAERKKIEAELRSVDHRGPRRPNVGGAEQRVRRDFRVHAALGLNPSAQIRARAEMLARTGAQSTSRRCSHDETAGTLVAMRSVDGDRAVPVFD